METSKWKKDLESERENKDIFFGQHFQSPVPFETRIKFKGLNYFSADPRYRFEIVLHEHEKKETITVQDTQENKKELLRWGEFRFIIDNQECVIQAYKSDPAEERLFIPFRDTTSGKETYGAGRYIDLKPEDDYNEGKWILDFNKAYNPWCAYSNDYSCPLVPPENWLKVTIRAGEKNYKKEE